MKSLTGLDNFFLEMEDRRQHERAGCRRFAACRDGPGAGQGPGWGSGVAGIGQRGAFGGFKQSGIGREWGHHGFEMFTEVKQISWS